MNKKIMTEVIIPYMNEDASKDQECKSMENDGEEVRERERWGRIHRQRGLVRERQIRHILKIT